MSLYLLEEYDRLHRRQGREAPKAVQVGQHHISFTNKQVRFVEDDLLEESEPGILQCSGTESTP